MDHGKSTLLGRLYADTGSLPEGKLEKVQAICRQQGKEFEYAFLFDAFLEEQEQGITIDTARTFFSWQNREVHHHRRAWPQRVPEEYGLRRGEGGGGAAAHRRRGGGPGAVSQARLSPVAAGRPPGGRSSE